MILSIKVVLVILFCNLIFAQDSSKLLKALKDKNYSVRIAALQEFLNMEAKAHFAVYEFKETLKEASRKYVPYIYRQEFIGYIPISPISRQAVYKRVQYDNPAGTQEEYLTISYMVIKILGQIGPKAIDAVRKSLIKRLQDDNAYIRDETKLTLIKIIPENYKFKEEELTYVIHDLILGLKDRDTREPCLEALGRLGSESKEAIPNIIKVIKDEEELKEIRLLYLENLIKISTDSSTTKVLLFLKKQEEFKDVAIEKLAEISDKKEALEGFLDLKNDENKPQKNYLDTYENIEDEDLNNELFGKAEEPDSENSKVLKDSKKDEKKDRANENSNSTKADYEEDFEDSYTYINEEDTLENLEKEQNISKLEKNIDNTSNTKNFSSKADVFAFSTLMIFIFVYLFLAFLPYIVAQSRNHKQAVPILLCALFFPFVGWIGALIWAFMSGPNQGGYIERKRTLKRARKLGTRRRLKRKI